MGNYGTYTYNTDLEASFMDGVDAVSWEVSIEIDCTSPGRPAKLYGLPEDCYPAEDPEFEWTMFHCFVGSHTIIETPYETGIDLVFGEETRKLLLDKAFDAAMEAASDEWEP